MPKIKALVQQSNLKWDSHLTLAELIAAHAQNLTWKQYATTVDHRFKVLRRQ